MIRESLYFSFNGRKSTNYPILNVKIGSGAYEESISSGQTINETYPRNAFKPYFFGTQKNVKEFSLSFAFSEPWNDELIDEIVRWLAVEDYKPLFFEADIDRVFYAMPVSSINQIHNGLKEGYVSLTVRCDSGYSYSHEIITPPYDTTKEYFEHIEVVNRGHYTILPEIFIEKISEGDIVINNISHGNQEIRIRNVDIGEKLYIDNMNEIIETDKENTFRYDDFNDEYLEIIYGKNILKVSSNVVINFKYQYIFS